MTRHVLFLIASARIGGNSQALARMAARSLADGTTQTWIDLNDPPLPAFHDLRPNAQAPDARLTQIATAMQAATDIVFVAPVYWYALPAPAKLLLDHWSGWLDLPAMGFAQWIKAKHLWLITARADAAPDAPDATEACLRKTADWLGMGWGGALHGVADGPGDILRDTAALARAARFFSEPA